MTDYALFDRGVDAYYGDNSLTAIYNATNTTGLLNPADSTIVNNIANGQYWLRILRNGGTIQLLYS